MATRSAGVLVATGVLVAVSGLFIVLLAAGHSQARRTRAGGTQAGGTQVGGTQVGGTQVGGTRARRHQASVGADSPIGRGALEGFVRLSGDTVPRPTRVENTTDPEVCGQMQTLDDILVLPGERGIKNVIVALAGVAAADQPVSRPSRLVLDNRECQFVPHASVLTVGSTIVATNSDPLLHTVHFYGTHTANVALPFTETTVSTTAELPGMIIVKCDVHGWMQAFIRVDPHPFHAVTDESGHFRIEDIPAGTYDLEAWHERLGQQQHAVRIDRDQTEIIEIAYRLEN